MFVYIWKCQDGTPFYVGLTKRIGRANPRNSGGRNWLTRQKLETIGLDTIVVEIRHVNDMAVGCELERELILKYGRVQMGTGPLTNLREGGEGMHSPTPEHRAKLRTAMLDPNHPIRSIEARAKQRERMNSPEVQALFVGDANPAKRPEVRAKLQQLWQDPVYAATQRVSRTGKKHKFSPKTRAKLATSLRANPAMKGWSERNGKDPAFDAKRVAGIKAAQPLRREKMMDPAALAQRKARLKATMNSEAYKAKRAQRNTPEYREKLSAARRAYWEKKRTQELMGPSLVA